VTSSRTRVLDAIVVPASRRATNLEHAITMARALECNLVLLCSRDAWTAEVSEVLAARSLSHASVIDLPKGYRHDLFEFDTSLPDLYPPFQFSVRDTDLSMKRNVGLALARMLGWKRIFFLDDDIRDFESADLRETVSMLRRYNTVGMRVTNFPDNSVVCHAHRKTVGFQDVLVSGSALAVDCTARIGFFPDIYNEDWFFFHDDAAKGSLGCSGRHATQLRYDPFADPERAAKQEFGDVLAEGLYALLHRDRRANATLEYWVHFLAARRNFLDAIIDNLGRAQPGVRPKIRAAVEMAQQCLAEIKPELCESYVAAWRKDREVWHERLEQVPAASAMSDALDWLGLKADQSCDAGPPFATDMPRGAPAGTVQIHGVPTLNGRAAKGPVRPAANPAGTAKAGRARPAAREIPALAAASRAILASAGRGCMTAVALVTDLALYRVPAHAAADGNWLPRFLAILRAKRHNAPGR
jgi:hypothetical protein